jgi:hypothetical protein
MLLVGSLLSGGIGWSYRATCQSIRDEHALHAVNLVTVVVDEYVQKEGRWPSSWQDLKDATSTARWGEYTWPDDREDLQRQVVVDFDADLALLAMQTPEEFDAIRLAESCRPYKQYGYVAELIETAKKATVSPARHTR